jgi:transposase-like protein
MTEHGDHHFKCPHCGEPIETRKARSTPAHKFNHDAAIALLDAGMSTGQVARIFGVTHQAVAYVAKRRNHT